MEDNLTSADLLSYTTNGSGVDLGSLVSGSCVHKPNPILWAPKISEKDFVRDLMYLTLL